MSKEFNRALINFDMPYESDPEIVIDAIEKELEGYVDDRIISPPEVQGVVRFGESGYVLRVRCDCKPGLHHEVERALRVKILHAFEKAGVDIPYTTRAINVEINDMSGLEDDKGKQ